MMVKLFLLGAKFCEKKRNTYTLLDFITHEFQYLFPYAASDGVIGGCSRRRGLTISFPPWDSPEACSPRKKIEI